MAATKERWTDAVGSTSSGMVSHLGTGARQRVGAPLSVPVARTVAPMAVSAVRRWSPGR